jgi:uncharacterized membrane protein YhiD involved in acid resistance
MDFFSSLFGNLTNGIIRLGVTVGILAAVYFFIVKPVLHTTEHSIDTTNKAFENSFDSSTFDTKAIEDQVNKAIEDVNNHTQVQVERSFHVTKVQGTPKKQQKLLHCVQRSNGNVHRMERCAKRFS